MSESLFRIIVLSSLVYPYLEFDNEQNAIRPLLIKQEIEQIEWFLSFLLIPSILE